MKKIVLLLIFLISLIFSQEINEFKTDIYLVNTIFQTEGEAYASRDILRDTIMQDLYDNSRSKMDKEVNVKLAFNKDYGFTDDVSELVMQLNEDRYSWSILVEALKLAIASSFGKAVSSIAGSAQLANSLENLMSANFEGFTVSRLMDIDIKEHLELYKDSIRQGHGVVVVGHGQGELFANQEYDKLLGSWYADYYRRISVASASNSRISILPYVAFDNDLMVVLLAMNKNDDTLIKNENRFMYFDSEFRTVEDVETWDFHNFNYYMGEEIRINDENGEDWVSTNQAKNIILSNIKDEIQRHQKRVSQYGVIDELHYGTKEYRVKMRHSYDADLTNFIQNEEIYPFFANPNESNQKLRKVYLATHADYAFRQNYVLASMGGELIHEYWDGQQDNEAYKLEGTNPTEYIYKVCRRPGDFAVIDEVSKNTFGWRVDVYDVVENKTTYGVYPFNKKGSLYELDSGEWVLATCGGESIKKDEENDNNICYFLNDNTSTTIDTMAGCDVCNKSKPKVTNGYVEVSLNWENPDIDMDLIVSFPGAHDVKDICEPFEHFYSPDINYRYVGEGLYPVYVRYRAGEEITSNRSLMEMMGVVVSIKVPDQSEARHVNLKTIDSLPGNGHIADIRVKEKEVEVILRDEYQKNSTVLYYGPTGGYSIIGDSGGGFGGGGSSGGGGGGGWSYQYTPVPPYKEYIYSIIWHISQALLGPLTGAQIGVYALEDYDLDLNKGSNPIHVNTSSYGSSVYTAGVISMPREMLDSLDDEKLYVVEAKGGLDIDANDDKVVDATPTINAGTTRVLTSGSALKHIGFKINILTEMAYQVSKKYYDENDLSKLMDKSDEVIRCTFKDDINLDNVTNTIDALYFTPYNDKGNVYHDYYNNFMPIIKKMQKNEDIYEDSFKLYARPLVKGGYFSVNEDVSVGAIIGKIETDCTSESPVHLFTLSGAGSENFEVDSEGNLKIAKQLVYEERRIYSLQVIGANAYGDSPPSNVYVTVTADNTPIITSFLTTYAIENMPNGVDIGNISINSMGYPITNVRLEGYGAEYFSINNTGNLRVAQGDKIDVKDKVYNLRVIAANVFGESASSPIIIKIYDDIPVILGDLNIRIKDNIAADTAIGKFSHYQGLSSVKGFSLEGFGVENFNIDSTGTIRINQNANLSVDNSPYILRATAINDQGGSDIKYAFVEVISSVAAIHNITLTPFSANMYAQAKNGSNVGGIRYAYGYTPPTSFTLSGEGSERFNISGGGYITLIDNTGLTVGQIFNLEANASNEYGSSEKSQVTITLIDDFISLYGLGISIVEGLDAGTAIGKVGYSYGVNPPTSFELLGDEADDFSIDNSGVIRVENVLNYDIKQKYTFNVKAVSDIGKSAIAAISVNIVDDAPVLRDTTLNIMENSYGGEILGYVGVSSSGKSKIVSFSLSGEGAEHFSINDQGLIRVGIGANIDYETRAVYHLKATATNSHDISNEANITINVVNAPDQDPMLISTTLHVDENSLAGTVVGDMAVYSNGADDIVSFVIEGVNSDWFDIDDKGKITVSENAILDYEKKQVFDLKAKAANSYGYSALVDLVINLNDLPDTPPTIKTASFYIDENLPEDSFVGQIQVYGAGAPILSVDLTGEGSENFKVYNNGTIVVAKGADIDYEKKTSYNFATTASNEFFTSSVAYIYISIRNLPDNPPTLSDIHYSIYKETPADRIIGTIKLASSVHCDIQKYEISDNLVFGIKDNGQIYTKTVTSEANYTLDVYALSACGDSNIAKLTIDSKNRIEGESTGFGSISSIVLSADDSKAFVGDSSYNYYGDYGFKILDISDSKNPILLGFLDTRVNDIAISSDEKTAFIVDYSSGLLKILDISNLTNPKLINQLSLPISPNKIVISSDDKKVFISPNHGSLNIVDVSDLSKPTIIGSVGDFYTLSLEISPDNTKLFSAHYTDGLKVIDITDATNPYIEASIQLYLYDVAISKDGTKVFAANYLSGLQILDISDLSDISIIGEVFVGNNHNYIVTVSNNESKAFISHMYTDINTIDITNEENPILVSTFGNIGRCDQMVLTKDDLKAVFGCTGILKIIDMDDIANDKINPGIKNSTFSVDENSLAETFVGQLAIYNLDSVTSIELSGQGAENFKIYNNGTIVVAQGVNLDYENKTGYNLQTTAYNEYGASYSVKVTININNLPDTPPTIRSANFYIDENLPEDSFVGQLKVDGAGAPILSIDLTGEGSEDFKVYNNGTIVVAKGANIDYEKKTYYGLGATVSNEFFTSSATSVSVSISNLRDTLPVLQDTNLSIYKTILANKTVGAIKVIPAMYCDIAEYVSDDSSVFGIRDNGEVYTKINVSGGHHIINVYALSSCGNSNTVKLIIDTQNRIISSINVSSFYDVYDISFSPDSTKAFVADSSYNLKIIDISDPINPIILGSINKLSVYDIAISSDNTKAFVVGNSGLNVIDISDPINPTILGSISTSSALAVALSPDNTKAFVVGNSGLNVIDISDPINPTLLGSVSALHFEAVTLSSDNTKAFVTAYDSLQIIDVSDPANPILLGSISTSSAQAVTLSSDNTKAFVVGYSGLNVIDVSDPINPTFLGSISTSSARAVTLSSDNTKVFVAEYYNGLKIIDVSDPANPTLLGSISISHAEDVALFSDNTKAFVVTDNNGLKIVDIEDFIKGEIPPIISNAVFNVNENSLAETFVGKLAVYNLDSIASIELLGDGSANFKVYNNGTVVVAQGANLDYERIKSYTLYVTAYNEFGKSNNATITINVNDLSDIPPIIKNSNFYIDENSPTESFIGQLNIDDDGSPVISIIVNGKGAEDFKVYNNGTIVVAQGANLDYEKIKSYILYITAYNELGKSNNATITININNLYDTLPAISNDNYLFYVNENSLEGAFIGKLNIQNIDNIQIISSKLIGEGSENFELFNNGTVVVAQGANLDYETKKLYMLNAKVITAMGDSEAVAVTINVNDLIDTAPVLESSRYSVYKNAPINRIAGYIKVISDMHCDIEGFVIDNNLVFGIKDDGEIYIKTALSKDVYTINVYAISSCGNSDSVNLIIDTKNSIISEIGTYSANAVALSSDNTKVFVADNYDGLKIIDVSDHLNPTLIGSIDTSWASDVTLSSDNTKAFVADVTGGLKIIDVSDLAKPTLISTTYTHNFANGVVLSSDNTKAFVADGNIDLTIFNVSNPTALTHIVSIDLDGYSYNIALSSNNKRVFIADGNGGLKIVNLGYYQQELEYFYEVGSIGTNNALDVVLSFDEKRVFVADYSGGLKIIDVSDPTKPAIIGSMNMSYAQAIALSSDNAKAFVADGSNGLKIVDVSNPANPTLIDTVDTYNALDVVLSSDETTAFVADAEGGLKIIDIQEFIKIPSAVAIFRVNENSFGETFVGQLNIGNISTIGLYGVGSENFRVYNNGTIVVAEGANLDYETTGSYDLYVTTYDGHEESNISVRIIINDLLDSPPIFEEFTQYFSVNENSPKGTVVGELIINNVISPITFMELSGEEAWRFKVDNNGTITLVNDTSFYYDRKSTYYLFVTAHNKFGASNTGYVLIYVNAPPTPYVSDSWFAVEENSPSGTVIGELTINDHGNSITSIHFDGEGSENFNVALDGTVTVANGAVLDYETRRDYNFRVFAVNEYGKSNIATVYAYLENIPDSPPVISGTIINLDKSAQAGDEVGYLSIYADESGIDDISLSGDGNENFDIITNEYCSSYGCYPSIHVSQGANIDYFNEGIYKMYATASNEFGSSSAVVWVMAGRSSKISPPTFDNITFVTFGDGIEEGDVVGTILPSSIIYCEITSYFIDNDKFTIDWWDEGAEIIANKFIEGDKVYHLGIYANSTCGVSNSIDVAVDTKSRITTFETDTEYYGSSLFLIDNETKLFVNNYENDPSYILDLKDDKNSHYFDLQIDQDANTLPMTTMSKDGKYLYVTTYKYIDGENYYFSVYDISYLDNPILIGSVEIDEVEYEEWCSIKAAVSKDGDKVFLQGCDSIQIVDVSNPYLPAVVSEITLGDYANIISMSMSKDEKTVYVVIRDDFDSSVIQRYDISSLSNPIKLTPISFANAYAIIAMSEDNTLAYAVSEYGLATYDITDANNPILVNLRNRLSGYYYAQYMNAPISLNNDKLLFSDRVGNPFTIFDFSDPIKPYISAVRAESIYPFEAYNGFVATSNKSKLFTSEENILMIDIENIGK
ncbi:MAG: cadherin domain-containing protein [Campylobacteraceae bacterium]|jgi:hypothetical protein|nr:cadherin domain-containing protein [Campylobacteraceae bacterium]